MSRAESDTRFNRSEKGRARRQRYRERHKTGGLCVSCTEPAASGIYCYDHARRSTARKAEWRIYNPGAEGFGIGGW